LVGEANIADVAISLYNVKSNVLTTRATICWKLLENQLGKLRNDQMGVIMDKQSAKSIGW